MEGRVGHTRFSGAGDARRFSGPVDCCRQARTFPGAGLYNSFVRRSCKIGTAERVGHTRFGGRVSQIVRRRQGRAPLFLPRRLLPAGETERERERGRERDTHTHAHTHRERERDRDRDTHTQTARACPGALLYNSFVPENYKIGTGGACWTHPVWWASASRQAWAFLKDSLVPGFHTP